MSDAMAIAASGLKAEEFNLDRIANNMANLNTNNYKATQLKFADMVYQPITSDSPFNTNNSGKIGMGAAVINASKDFRPGPLKTTANWNDLAINGQGFFQVMLNDGQVAYTRASTFTIDKDRYLTTENGQRLYDNIQVPDDYVKITVQKNGDVLVALPNEQQPQLIGSIKLAKFMSPENLEPLSNGLFKETEQSGRAFVDIPGESGLGDLAQGQIESSNVDMVDSIMQLTMAQRIYQINAKALQVADEMEKETNEIRG